MKPTQKKKRKRIIDSKIVWRTYIIALFGIPQLIFLTTDLPINLHNLFAIGCIINFGMVINLIWCSFDKK